MSVIITITFNIVHNILSYKYNLVRLIHLSHYLI